MRLILVSILCYSFVACTSNTPKIGKWYSPIFGVLIVQDNALTFYPNQTPPETWKYDNKKGLYEYSGTCYQHCLLSKNEDILYIEIEQKSKDNLIIKKVNDCFPASPFNNDVTLYRIPEDIKLDFDYISIMSQANGEKIEKRLTKSDFLTLNSPSNILSIEQQIWLLFASGIDYNTELHQELSLKIRGKHSFRSKSINSVTVPLHMKELFTKLRE